MKMLGSILLGVGFLAGSLVVVSQVAAVNWMHYSVCIGLMVAGMICLRMSRGSEAGEAEKHEGRLDTLQASLDQLVSKITAYTKIDDDHELLQVHRRIDAELMQDFDAFVQARESMIPRLGMQNYADILSPFANGERLINRVWSASVDGYVDEVRSCIQQALASLEDSRSRLLAARK